MELNTEIQPWQLIACPHCKAQVEPMEGGQDLLCQGCGFKIAFRDGVYQAGTEFRDESAARTVEEFGKRWNDVYEDMGGLKDFLMPMIEPVQESFFKNKIIVDAGGGFGRLSKIMLDYGAKHVVLLDASSAVYAAAEYLADCKDRVTLVRGNLLSPPLADGVLDLFFCHGVLHHTGDAYKVIQNMSRKVKKDTGSMILWVYADEGNKLLSKLLNIVRMVSMRIGDSGRWALAGLMDVLLWALTKGIYSPLAMIPGVKHRLWYGEYFLDFLFDPRINNRIDRLQMYHDFLTTDIVEYYSKDQLKEWTKEAGYIVANYFFYRKQSWSVAASFNAKETFS